MNNCKNNQGKRLFGILDSALHIKTATLRDIYFAWGDLVRLFNLMTTGNARIFDMTSRKCIWESLNESYGIIQKKVYKTSSVNDLADLAIELTDQFVKMNRFSRTDNDCFNIPSHNLLLKESIKKYLGLISAYEESFCIIPEEDIKKMRNRTRGTARFILQNFLKYEREDEKEEYITKVIKKLVQEINDYNRIQKTKNDDSYNRYHPEYAYSLIMGGVFNDYPKNLCFNSIYDILIARAFLTSAGKDNPYLLLLKEMHPEIIKSSEQIIDTLTSKMDEGKEGNRHLLKEFNKLYELQNFLGHFALGRKMPKLCENNASFVNLSIYLAERFSQTNFINLLSFWYNEYMRNNKQLIEIIENDKCYPEDFPIISTNESYQILVDIIKLSSCPLVDLRMQVAIHILKTLMKANIDSLPRIINDAKNAVSVFRFYTFYYLPFLQIIFRLLLSIFYIKMKSFPSNEQITHQVCNLYSFKYDYDIRKRILPSIKKHDISDKNYNIILSSVFYNFYESITLPREYSFSDYLIQYFYKESNCSIASDNNQYHPYKHQSFCDFITAQLKTANNPRCIYYPSLGFEIF